MTIGEKIANLRAAAHISQEQLAEKLSVSRQSVSKWEINQSLPQIDNVLTLCKLFRVTADALLRNDVSLFGDVAGKKSAINETGAKNKYFGTDGFRGEANVTLTSDQAYKVGRFLGWYYSSPLSGFHMPNYRPRILIGKDTRRSSYTLEYAIASGITSSGADAYMLHVTTTPSVSYVTRTDEFDCGIMITASHNPYYDNGIKLINRYGEKMDDATTEFVEAYLDGNIKKLGIDGDDIPFAHRDGIGSIVDYVAGRNRYVGYLISVASHSYKDLRIGLDCANGASWMIAKAVFDALGAKTYVIGASPDGLNVNKDCGSTHIENLIEFVRENRLDAGFAFDGDADRVIATDERGNIVDGDRIMGICAKAMKAEGRLKKDTLVVTVMSNIGLKKRMTELGINVAETKVGDRYVLEEMLKEGYSIGGEQSGHVIFLDKNTTGDGMLTAIQVLDVMKSTGRRMSALANDIPIYPQVLVNVIVDNEIKHQAMEDQDLWQRIREVEGKLGSSGRVLVRASGTEPIIRVMLEGQNTDEISDCAIYIVKVLEQKYKGKIRV